MIAFTIVAEHLADLADGSDVDRIADAIDRVVVVADMHAAKARQRLSAWLPEGYHILEQRVTNLSDLAST